jgi:hypothetical protein
LVGLFSGSLSRLGSFLDSRAAIDLAVEVGQLNQDAVQSLEMTVINLHGGSYSKAAWGLTVAYSATLLARLQLAQ